MREFIIPKLLLQPLVENAVVHGLEPTEKGMLLQLSAMEIKIGKRSKAVLISIINNGAPYKPDKSKPDSKRIGLENVKNRLMLYNSEAVFVIKGGENRFTECHVIIPFI